MNTPNEKLLAAIGTALIVDGLISEKEMEKLSSRILAGEVKPEDWYSAIEMTLAAEAEESKDVG